MKYILLFAGVIGIGLISNAQAPKNTKRITISTNSSADDNYLALGTTLLDKGYQIDGDKEFLTIRTTDTQIKGSNAYVQFYFVCKDHEIEVSGRVTVPVIEKHVYVDIENKGTSGFPLKESFEDMEKLAASLGTVSRYR